MADLREQLRGALDKKGWTHERLLRESGLEGIISVPSLNRKLNQQQGMSGKEGLALAKALGVRVDGASELRIVAKLGLDVSWKGKRRSGKGSA